MIDLFPALDSTPELLGAGLAVALVYVLPIWAWSVKKEDVSIIDPFWGLGFVLLGWFWALGIADTGPRQLLILAMVTVWGLRLSIYLGWRKRGEPEDRRYQEMRKAHPETFAWRSLFTVFLLQGFLIWLIAAPLFAAQRGGPEVPGTSNLGPLEKDLTSTKPRYEDYVRRTNAFFPGPPRD